MQGACVLCDVTAEALHYGVPQNLCCFGSLYSMCHIKSLLAVRTGRQATLLTHLICSWPNCAKSAIIFFTGLLVAKFAWR